MSHYIAAFFTIASFFVIALVAACLGFMDIAQYLARTGEVLFFISGGVFAFSLITNLINSKLN